MRLPAFAGVAALAALAAAGPVDKSWAIFREGTIRTNTYKTAPDLVRVSRAGDMFLSGRSLEHESRRGDPLSSPNADLAQPKHTNAPEEQVNEASELGIENTPADDVAVYPASSHAFPGKTHQKKSKSGLPKLSGAIPHMVADDFRSYSQYWQVNPLSWPPIKFVDPVGHENGEQISQEAFDNIKYIAEFEAASYCPGNNLDSSIGRALNCTESMCPSISGKARIVAARTEPWVNWSSARSTYKYTNSFYVAVDDSKNSVVVTFRGSSWKNRLSALKNLGVVNLTRWTDVPQCSDCYVSASFLEAWQNIKPEIVEAIVKNTRDGYRVIFSGHSAGAALATIAVGDARTDPRLSSYPIDLYSFGSPRVGDAGFATFVTNQTLNGGVGYRGDNYRVVHASDPVPHWVSHLKHRHLAPEYWITAPGATNRTSDVLYFQPSYNSRGAVVEEEKGSWSKNAGPSHADQHAQYIIALYYSYSKC